MLSCKEVTRLVSESLDRQLPLRQRLAVRMHLLLCKACTRYRRQLLFIKKVVPLIKKVVPHFPVDIEEPSSSSAPSLPPEARERIKRSLKAQDR